MFSPEKRPALDPALDGEMRPTRPRDYAGQVQVAGLVAYKDARVVEVRVVNSQAKNLRPS